MGSSVSRGLEKVLHFIERMESSPSDLAAMVGALGCEFVSQTTGTTAGVCSWEQTFIRFPIVVPGFGIWYLKFCFFRSTTDVATGTTFKTVPFVDAFDAPLFAAASMSDMATTLYGRIAADLTATNLSFAQNSGAASGLYVLAVGVDLS